MKHKRLKKESLLRKMFYINMKKKRIVERKKNFTNHDVRNSFDFEKLFRNHCGTVSL